MSSREERKAELFEMMTGQTNCSPYNLIKSYDDLVLINEILDEIDEMGEKLKKIESRID